MKINIGIKQKKYDAIRTRNMLQLALLFQFKVPFEYFAVPNSSVSQNWPKNKNKK